MITEQAKMESSRADSLQPDENEPGPLFPDNKPWRKDLQDFSEKALTELKNFGVGYEPLEELPVKQANILMVGPIGAGKSSFFNTINSIYKGHVTAQATTGTDPDSLTKRYRTYETRSERRGKVMNFRLCDTMGLEEADQGLDVTDFDYLLDGYVPNNFEFKAGERLANSIDVNKAVELKDKIHVLVIVINAINVEYIEEFFQLKLRKIKQHADKRAIPVLVLLTHVDLVCDVVKDDVTKVYHSRAVYKCVQKAAKLMRMPASQVIPVKNYETETELDTGVNIVAMHALRQLIRLSDNFFDEQMNKLDISLASADGATEGGRKAESQPQITEQSADKICYHLSQYLPGNVQAMGTSERPDVVLAGLNPTIRKRLAGLLCIVAGNQGGQERLVKMLYKWESEVIQGKTGLEAHACILEWMAGHGYTVAHLGTILRIFEVQTNISSIIRDMTVPGCEHCSTAKGFEGVGRKK